MNKDLMKFNGFTVFMLFLVLMMPINSSLAFASLRIDSIQGVNTQVDDYKKQSENAVITVSAQTGGVIVPSDLAVQVGSSSNQFNECVKKDNSDVYECTYYDGYQFYTGSVNYNVVLLPTSESRSRILYIDDVAPTVDSFSISTTLVEGDAYVSGDVGVTAKLTDGPASSCSGVNTVQVFIDGSYTILATFSGAQVSTSGCTTQVQGVLALSSLSDGLHTICVAGTDALGNKDYISNKRCQDVYVDNHAPTVSALTIMDTHGRPVKFFSPIPQQVVVEVLANSKVVPLDDLSGSVYADISDLNAQFGAVQGMTCAEDATQDGVYICRLTLTALVDNPQLQSVQVGFETSDPLGNTLTSELSYAVRFDALPPSFSSLGSYAATLDENDELVYWVGEKQNEFFATISDDVSGFSKQEIFIVELGNVLGECSGTKTVNCYWNRSSIMPQLGRSGSTYTLTYAAFDDALNVVTQKQTFSVDKDAPILNGVTINANGNDYIVAGDDITLSINVSDDSGLKSEYGGLIYTYADLSVFGGQRHELADDCELQGDDWICTWLIRDVAPVLDPQVTFEVCDIVHNCIEGEDTRQSDFLFSTRSGFVSGDASVLVQMDSPNPDFWTVNLNDIVYSPSAGIDRQLMEANDNSTIPFPYYVVIPFTSSSSAEIVEFDFIDGSGCVDVLGNSGLIQTGTPRLLYFEDNTAYLQFIFRSNSDGYANIDSFNLTCTFNILSRYDNQYSQFENERVNVTIDVYNNPLGELSSGVRDELKDVSEGWIVQQDWIETLNTLATYAAAICKLVQVFVTMHTLFATESDLAALLLNNPVTGPGAAIMKTEAYAGREIVRGATSVYGETMQTFCSLVNCDLTDKANVDDEVEGILWDILGTTDYIDSFTTPDGKPLINVQNSLILSLGTGCIPGIIYGLKKWRAVECGYMQCLKNSAEGQPVSQCKSFRDYSMCKLVIGEVFNVLPIGAILDKISEVVIAYLTNPLLIGIAIFESQVCETACSSNTPTCTTCAWVAFSDWMLDALCSFGVGSDSCEQANLLSSLDVEDNCEAAFDGLDELLAEDGED